MEESFLSEALQAASGKEKFQLIAEMVVRSTIIEWFLGFEKNRLRCVHETP